ncbi:MAG: OmpA family protein [Moritella sp.]|uniref:OmpA family protein n=1 Tax=Moritella sp. TaxID=78556 RepID=UPI0025D11F40|nr:OmpA family protein [Moritella sp.]NQZ91260.1 OmpA family protein [Moritella sp.]
MTTWFKSLSVHRVTALFLVLSSLSACSTDTYVSNDNMDKFDVHVVKFRIRECLLPPREIKIAVAEHFAFDKTALMAADHAALDQFMDDIRAVKGRISIVAHTDYQGSKKYNEQLSKRRAESIKGYLSQGLDNDSYDWEIKYYGESKPLVKGISLKANASNRRAYLMFEQTIDKAMYSGCILHEPKPDRKIYITVSPHFAFDKAVLNEKDKIGLDAFARKLDKVTGRIMVAGYTDYLGALNYNEKLAKRRAQAVQEYLKTKVDPTQFIWEVKVFGESEPLSLKHSLKANALNRRAVIVFTEEELVDTDTDMTKTGM